MAGSPLPMLLVPLRPAALVTIAVLCGALTVSIKLAPFGLFLALILLSWFFKYSYTLLDATMLGATELPVLSVETILMSVGEWRSLTPLILVTFFFFLSGTASLLTGMAVTIAVAIPLLLILPAIVAVQGWTGSAAEALHPRRLKRMANHLGNDYPLIAGASLIVTAVAIAAQLFADRVPLFFRIVLFVYLWLGLFAMTGRSIFRNRSSIEQDTLFLRPEIAENSARMLAQDRQAWLDSIYVAARSGAQQGAWQTVLRRFDTIADPLPDLRWAYERVAQWQFAELTNRVAAELVGRLLDQGSQYEAAQIARERMAVDARFRPRRAADTLRLAMYAGTSADRALAIQLLDRFDEYYPNDELREKAGRLRHTLQSGVRSLR